MRSKDTFRRRLAMFLLLSMVMTILFAGGCASKEGKEKKTFIVGFDAEFPPYGYKDYDGEYVGFDLDLAQEVADRNGYELIKRPIDWNSKDMELDSGAIDCIWNGFTINGRENDYTWSSAYIDNSQVVVVKSDSSINQLSDLAGKTVAVQADSSALAAFTGEDATEENIALCASFKKLMQIGDYNSAFMELEVGSVDAICMDIGVAGYQIANRKDAFRILEEQVSSEQYGIGFKLGNTELRDTVEETLKEMVADGTFDRIASKWGLSDAVCFGKEGSDWIYYIDGKDKTEKSFGERMAHIMSQLWDGMKITLGIFFATLMCSLPLGLLVMYLRMSRIKLISVLTKIYISIMRGTPLMLQLIVICYGPHYVLKVEIPEGYRAIAIILGFSLNYAAYFAEIYRSGIESIPAGQHEAAQVLNYNKIQTFWIITFPQMVKRVLPPVTNEVITLVKDTSLAFAVSCTEMFTVAKQLGSADSNIIPLFVAGGFYYIFNFLVAFVMARVEKSLQYYSI